jgi:nitrate reductase cytochrome c-type subunit
MLRPVFFALACLATSVQAQAPPPITHPIDGYLVTRAENNCLECHDKPRDIGKKRSKGAPTPAPKSHYAGLEGKPEIAAGHFNCTSCHVKGK